MSQRALDSESVAVVLDAIGSEARCGRGGGAVRIGRQRFAPGSSPAYLHKIQSSLNDAGYAHFRLRCLELGLSQSEAIREALIASGLLLRSYSKSAARCERAKRRRELGVKVIPKRSKRGKGAETVNDFANNRPKLD